MSTISTPLGDSLSLPSSTFHTSWITLLPKARTYGPRVIDQEVGREEGETPIQSFGEALPPGPSVQPKEWIGSESLSWVSMRGEQRQVFLFLVTAAALTS